MSFKEKLYSIQASVINFLGKIQLFPYPLFLMMNSTHYKVKGSKMREVLNVIQPGDILLRRYKYYITGWFIPGHFTHAALYVGDNNVIHMLGDGITKEDILTFMRCDEIKVLRFPDRNLKNQCIVDKSIVIANQMLEQNVKYDYSFKSDNNKFYCTEMVDLCYEQNIKYRKRYSDKFITPDDMLSSNLEQII